MVVGVYPSDHDASVVLDTLKAMHRDGTIALIDAAKITKDDAGNVHIEETEELTAKRGAIRGAIVAGIFGLIYPPSVIVSAAVGGGLGALIGRLRDSGIKGEEMQEIAGHLTLDSVAIAALVEVESLADVEYAMKAMEGRLIEQPLSDDALKQLFIEQESLG
jgi:uncharacterized membrane protein